MLRVNYCQILNVVILCLMFVFVFFLTEAADTEMLSASEDEQLATSVLRTVILLCLCSPFHIH